MRFFTFYPATNIESSVKPGDADVFWIPVRPGSPFVTPEKKLSDLTHIFQVDVVNTVKVVPLKRVSANEGG
jgi:hypothetical protein